MESNELKKIEKLELIKKGIIEKIQEKSTFGLVDVKNIVDILDDVFYVIENNVTNNQNLKSDGKLNLSNKINDVISIFDDCSTLKNDLYDSIESFKSYNKS